MFLLGQAIEILEELDGVGARKALGIVRKGLRDDAKSLHGIAAAFI